MLYIPLLTSIDLDPLLLSTEHYQEDDIGVLFMKL